MGEPAAAVAATSERDVLLATKLNVPLLGGKCAAPGQGRVPDGPVPP
jgi:hypothetical protein